MHVRKVGRDSKSLSLRDDSSRKKRRDFRAGKTTATLGGRYTFVLLLITIDMEREQTSAFNVFCYFFSFSVIIPIVIFIELNQTRHDPF